MRTADELILAAVNEHQRLMDDGKDPVEHVFYVTQEELTTLRDLPPVDHPMLNANRDRLCGLMLNIVSDVQGDEAVSDEIKTLQQECDWLRKHYDNLREWLPKHHPCLFCGSDIELRTCKCGGSPFMNLNDIYYTFFCGCSCGRGVSVVGYDPYENHERCVRLWNEKGWCADAPVNGDNPEWINGNPPPPEPEKQPPTLLERLAVFKANRRGN